MHGFRVFSFRSLRLIGALLVVGGLLTGCTHWGGSSGGHHSDKGYGNGGCQLDFQANTDASDGGGSGN